MLRIASIFRLSSLGCMKKGNSFLETNQKMSYLQQALKGFLVLIHLSKLCLECVYTMLIYSLSRLHNEKYAKANAIFQLSWISIYSSTGSSLLSQNVNSISIYLFVLQSIFLIDSLILGLEKIKDLNHGTTLLHSITILPELYCKMKEIFASQN